MKSRTCLIFYTSLFVSLNLLQAKPVLKRILLKELPQRHINLQTSKNTVYIRQRSKSCIDLNPRNTLCLVNQGGGQYGYHENEDNFPDIDEPGVTFVDLTRLEDIARTNYDNVGSFSEDYFDVNDLSISRKVDKDYLLLDAPLNHPTNLIKIIIINTASDKSKSPKEKSRKVFNLNDQGNGVVRSRYSDSSDEESGDKSSEDEDREDGEKRKPKRYEVVENSSEESKSSKSQEATSDELGVPAKQQGRTKVIYAQSPTRHLSLADRRRLPHFLPKRYHWSLDDIQHLPYLWFNGPQGQYPGIFRITS